MNTAVLFPRPLYISSVTFLTLNQKMKTPKIDIEFIRLWADIDDWDEQDHQPNIGLIIFRKGGMKMNIYLTKGTVTTQWLMDKQKVIRNLTQEQIADLLHEL